MKKFTILLSLLIILGLLAACGSNSTRHCINMRTANQPDSASNTTRMILRSQEGHTS